jgi:hypothetical protein
MKNKYHSAGITKNKKIREQRKKPLPLQLMIDGKWLREKEGYLHALNKRIGINGRRNEKDITPGKVI